LRLLAKLRARILIDQHRAFAQFLEPFGENVTGDAITRGLRLVIGEAIMLWLLRHRG
jgi:hypothetical protein